MSDGRPTRHGTQSPSNRPTLPPVGERVRPLYRLLGLLLAIIPFAAWPAGRWVLPYADLKWPLAAAGMVAALWLVGREIRQVNPPANQLIRLKNFGDPPAGRKAVYPWSPWLAGGMMILAGLALSALASPVIGLGLWAGLRESLFVLFALGLAFIRPGRRELRWVLGCLLAAMGAQALLALAQRSVPGLVNAVLPWSVPGTGERAAMIGSLGNPEYLASWLAVGLTLALVLASRLTGTRNPLRLLAAIVALLALIEIFISGGRGAILAALRSLAITAAVSRWPRVKATRTGSVPGASLMAESEDLSRRRIRVWLVSAVGLALAVILLGGVWFVLRPRERGGSLPGRLAELTNVYSPSVRHRIGLLAVTSRMIMDHPLLGAGPGLYGKAYSATLIGLVRSEPGIGFWSLGDVLTGNYVGEAHSDPLQWWAEYGLLPALGLGLMIVSALWGAWPALRRIPRGDSLNGALWASLLTLAINMWVSFPLHAPVRTLTFWALLGLLRSAGENEQ